MKITHRYVIVEKYHFFKLVAIKYMEAKLIKHENMIVKYILLQRSSTTIIMNNVKLKWCMLLWNFLAK